MLSNNFIYLILIIIDYSQSTDFFFAGWQDECRLELVPNLPLPIKCNATSYNCDQITCSIPFSREDITVTVNFDTWDDPMSADVTMSVPKLGFDWSARVKNGEVIEVPGFPLDIKGLPFGKVDASIRVAMTKDNGTLSFKVNCTLISI